MRKEDDVNWTSTPYMYELPQDGEEDHQNHLFVNDGDLSCIGDKTDSCSKSGVLHRTVYKPRDTFWDKDQVVVFVR